MLIEDRGTVPVSSFSMILLAAGLSRRMGRDKLMLEYNGKTFLQHSIDLMAQLPVFERIVVTSENRVGSVDIPTGFTVCINPLPEEGIGSTIRTGVEAATGTHYMFLTADQPKLTAEDILPLLEAAEMNPGKIVYPIMCQTSFGLRKSPKIPVSLTPSTPTIFPEGFRSQLLCLTGDTGGRVIRDKNQKLCLPITVDVPDNFVDIDNIEDYEGVLK